MMNFLLVPPAPREVAEDLFLYGSGAGDGEKAQTFPEVEHPPGFLLIAALCGEGAVTVDREPHPMVQGELLILPCSAQVGVSRGLGYSAVLVGGSLAHKYLLPVTTRLGVRLPAGASRLIAGTLRRIHSSMELGAARDGCWGSSKAFALLMELYTLPEPHEVAQACPLVEQAVEMIRTQYAYLSGIDELASRLAVSKHHLIRLFSKETGTPPGRYLTEVRIENAGLLLKSRKYNLEVVADMVGFASANYFCKVFKKATGMTPTEYGAANNYQPDAAEKLEQIFYL